MDKNTNAPLWFTLCSLSVPEHSAFFKHIPRLHNTVSTLDLIQQKHTHTHTHTHTQRQTHTHTHRHRRTKDPRVTHTHRRKHRKRFFYLLPKATFSLSW